MWSDPLKVGLNHTYTALCLILRWLRPQRYSVLGHASTALHPPP